MSASVLPERGGAGKPVASRSIPRRARAVFGDPAIAVVVATLLALALRLAASDGDPGLDEVWSMRLVEHVGSLGGVFWDISHDNNHFLNSVWLYWLGADAPVWAWRLPAVLLGTLTVPALARLCGRRQAAAGAVAALFGAVSMPWVDFGSEARGYAGLALATVVAFDAAGCAGEAVLAGWRDRAAEWRLGLAVGLGLLCHLTMAYAAAVASLALLIRAGVHRRPAAALRDTGAVLLPSALLALPAIACVLAGLANRGRFTLGGTEPFSLHQLVSGFGDMMVLTAGLPDTLPPWLGIAGALALLAVAARSRLVAPWTLAIGAAALIALPLTVAALRLPNVGYARYYSASGIALLTLLAEVLGGLLGDARDRRAAVLAILASVAGALVLDAAAIRDGRGGFVATLKVLSAEDPGPGVPTVASDGPAMAAMLLQEAARRTGLAAPTIRREADLCTSSPGWYLAVGTVDRRPEAAVDVGPAPCRARFVRRLTSTASTLSGTGSTLYRRDDGRSPESAAQPSSPEPGRSPP